LHLSVEGERMVVRGPKAAESLVRMILARKAEIMPLLQPGPPTTNARGSNAALMPWQADAEARAMLADLKKYCDKARPEPDPTWKSVGRICLNIVLESSDLDDLRRRCEFMKQIARGMPAVSEWGK